MLNTSVDIIRINSIDQSGPNLNSVLAVNPDALTIADSLDKILQNEKIIKKAQLIKNLIKQFFEALDC